MTARIVVTSEVRTLLGELDTLMRRFDEQTVGLSNGALSEEQTRAAIVGLANRMNKASVKR